jgi:transposase-like protein
MDFPLIDYLDEDACYRQLVALLHPDGLACPRCGQRQRLGVHHRHREPVLDYQCGDCGRVFNAWTGTILQGTHRRPSQLLLILHGVAKGQPTAEMARELGCDRKHLLELRHRLQEHARMWLDRNPLDDAAVEADEMYQNAGEKRHPAHRPGRPAAATGPSPMTGRRSPGSWAGTRGRSARRCSTTPMRPSWRS